MCIDFSELDGYRVLIHMWVWATSHLTAPIPWEQDAHNQGPCPSLLHTPACLSHSSKPVSFPRLVHSRADGVCGSSNHCATISSDSASERVAPWSWPCSSDQFSAEIKPNSAVDDVYTTQRKCEIISYGGRWKFGSLPLRKCECWIIVSSYTQEMNHTHKDDAWWEFLEKF